MAVQSRRSGHVSAKSSSRKKSKSFRHLLRISDLDFERVNWIISRAFKSPPRYRRLDPMLPAVGLLFTEPSTRTRISFERAAQRLGRSTILVDAQSTSLKKGETMEDTLLNLRELGVGTFVIRTSETGSLEALRSVDGVSLVNAGDGVGEHPTQALLDLATLVAHLGRGNLKKLKGLKLGILGDLRRSRVARSWSFLAPLVGIDLCVISPADWKPDWLGALSWTDQKTKALKNLDVLMALRVQKERMSPEDSGVEKFIRNFRVSPKDLSSDAMLMHPGPVNWGVELDVLLKKDERSLILDQVRMGLAVRSVVLDEIS